MKKPSVSQIERLISAVVKLEDTIAWATNMSRPPIVTPPAKDPPSPAPQPSPAAPHAAKPVSGVRYEELAAAVLKVAEVKGQSAAVAILKSFGATHAKQLPEDKYSDALAAFEAALAAPTALA